MKAPLNNDVETTKNQSITKKEKIENFKNSTQNHKYNVIFRKDSHQQKEKLFGIFYNYVMLCFN